MDTIILGTDFYTRCDINKLLVTSTKFVTIEGLSELASRAVGALFFEYTDLMGAFGSSEETGEPEYKPFYRGEFIGRAVQVTFKWSI